MIQEIGFGLRSNAGDLQTARDLAPVEVAQRPRATFKEIGARLFQGLFAGGLRETYLLSRGRFESAPDHGLRIRIVLPADGPDAGLLQALPWELLYCEQTRDFLARNVLTPVVRQLVLSGVSSPFPDTGESRMIRILIAVANPRGVTQLDDADERARILQAWCQQQSAKVELLRPATLRDLYEALRSDHYQVVHFISHGDFDAVTGVGSLLLETSEREPRFVSSEVLAETLQASRELRLVFLNSCRSAQVGYQPGQDPLLGAAAALVRRGVPAVLAMQAPISDVAASRFSEAVYRSLVRGNSLEAAVADGRLALYQTDPESWEWITPALFATLSESQVFRPLCSAAENVTAKHEEAIRLLTSRSYAKAQKLVEDCLERGEEAADLHYYRALALLGDRRPRFLKVQELRPIEASARRALDLDDCAVHHLCLLAFLWHDFYLENHLLPPEPGYEELLKRAAAAPLDPARLAELVRLVPLAVTVTDLVTKRVEGTLQ